MTTKTEQKRKRALRRPAVPQLDGNVRRAIDFRGGEKIDEKALKSLVKAAVALNNASVRR